MTAHGSRHTYKPLVEELGTPPKIDESVNGPRGRLGAVLRAYATELAGEDHEARRRLHDHYVHTCSAGALLLNPYRAPLALQPPAPGVVAVDLRDAASAMDWFRVEHAALVATVDASAAGFPAHTTALAALLTTFFDRRGHWSGWVRTQRTGLDAARRTHNRVGEAHAHRRLARAYTRMSRNAEAESHLVTALDLFAALGDDFGTANSHLDLAVVMEK